MSTRRLRFLLGVAGLVLVFTVAWLASGQPVFAAAAVGAGVALSVLTWAVAMLGRPADKAPEP